MYVVTQTLSFYQTTQHCTRALFKIEKRIPRKFKTSLFHSLFVIMHDILFVCWNPGSLFGTPATGLLINFSWVSDRTMDWWDPFYWEWSLQIQNYWISKIVLPEKKDQNKLDHCKFWMQDTVLCSLRFSSKLNFVDHWQNHFRI